MTNSRWRRHILIVRIALTLYISLVIKMLSWRWD